MRSAAAAVIVMVVAWSAPPLWGLYVQPEVRQVPVARLAENLERELAASPQDADIHIRLARLYGMAYAVNAEVVPVASFGRNGREQIWFGHEPPLVPHRVEPGTEKDRTEAARTYLRRSAEHYRAALRLDSGNLVARLGHGWTLEQAGDRAGAIAEYREVIARAWPQEAKVRGLRIGQRLFTAEAAGYLVPLLDPAKDAEEIAELERRAEFARRLPRPITPIAIPLGNHVWGEDPASLLALDARVPFDADGSGVRREWSWISPDAAWLVYDPRGTGYITSALQWFGNVTFWLFWANGYEALAALDDDGDGELTDGELRHLALWHDANSNGISDPGEVRPLSDHGIVALSWQFSEGDGVHIAAAADEGVRFEDGRVRTTYDLILRPPSQPF